MPRATFYVDACTLYNYTFSFIHGRSVGLLFPALRLGTLEPETKKINNYSWPRVQELVGHLVNLGGHKAITFQSPQKYLVASSCIISIMLYHYELLIGPKGQPPGEMVGHLVILHRKRKRASSYF